MFYENRLLLLVDILGWSSAILEGDGDTDLPKAVEMIHERATVHNERFRKDRVGKSGEPMLLQVQVRRLSDHFVYSLPVSYGLRIAGVAATLIVDLLRMGWLTRGAIVIGSLYHKDNVIFGPALLEAVDMEQITCFPRVQVSPGAMAHLAEFTGDAREQPIIRDHLGVPVVNPFVPGVRTDSKELMDRFIRENRGVAESKRHVERQIGRYSGQDDRRGDKWKYPRDFIGGPVIAAVPELKEHWA